MKKQLPGFLTGVVATVLVFTAAPALATAATDFLTNQVNIALNGQQVAAKGENYTLA